jgi:hypothetical protein
LRQIADYSCRLNVNESNPEKKVEEFISFLPVLAYDGSSMKQIDAAGILDMAMSGTTATMLARRWESALLVNVDNGALQRLMNIEGFRKGLRQKCGYPVFQTLISPTPITPSPSCLPLEGGETLCFVPFWTKTLPVFPPLQGSLPVFPPSEGGQGGGGLINCVYP